MDAGGGDDRAAARALLDRRADLRLVVIDTPAGHGRSELIWRAVHDSLPGLRDVDVPPLDGPGEAPALASRLHRALGRDGPVDPEGHGVAATVDLLASSIHADGPLCLVIDDAHRSGDEGLRFLGALVRALPRRAHLVVGGAGLDGLGVGDLLADGSAVRIDTLDLPAVDSLDDRVVADLLLGAARSDISACTRDLLACLVALDQSRLDVAERIAMSLDLIPPVTELERLPRVRLVEDHVHLDPAWRDVDLPVDAAVLRAAAAAAAGRLLETGDLEEAGRLAVESGDRVVLRRAVRSALSANPPRAGSDSLRQWNESSLLADDDPHGWWLDGACRARRGEALDDVLERYHAARLAFAATGDIDAEVSVGLAIGILARHTNDVGTLGALVARSREIAAEGDRRALAVGLLGDALVRQLSGDPAGAVEVLEGVPVGALEGDWSAQLSMLRGTNLMLCGRLAEAEVHLEVAVGSGSAWSYATALRLLALVHWLVGRRSLALDDLETAANQALALGAVVTADDCLAIRAAMAALMGRPDAPELTARATGGRGLDDAARVALDVARAAIAVNGADLAAATAIAAELPVPSHASPPAHWVVGLVVALVDDRSASLRAVVDAHPSLQLAWEAGARARSTVSDGSLVGAEHLPYLPASWCEVADPEVRIDLLGTARIAVDGKPVDHPYWERARVRELCLYLALVTGGSRTLAAERLWPDLAGPAAARNLRVTLAHLLDVLDPNRRKGAGSSLIDERNGLIALIDADRLVIDVRDEQHDATTLVAASSVGDDSTAMAAARRLVRRVGGALLGGGNVGEWADELERDRRDLLLRAVSIGAPGALALSDHDLAEALARRGLGLDPWAERLHQVVVRSRVQRDDLDGARRALRDCIRSLGELAVRPEAATRRLARDLGIPV